MVLFTVITTVFTFGLVIGSFLNVVILRGLRNESLGGRSKCLSCQKELSVLELIPVLSFIIQKGKCRECGISLLWQYPLVEFSTGALFSAAFWYLNLFALNIETVIITLLTFIGLSASVVIFVTDLKAQIIPNKAALILFILGVIASIYRLFWGFSVFSYEDLKWSGLEYDAGAALAIALFFAALWFFSQGRWMGFGDAKLIGATSLILGYPVSLTAFLLSFWLGGLAGAILLVFGKKSMQSQLPFGPFILIGSAVAYLYSPQILGLIGLL